jgi:hypothetical protein
LIRAVGIKPAALFVCRKDKIAEKMGLFRSFYVWGDTVYPTVRLTISDSYLLTYEKTPNFMKICY